MGKSVESSYVFNFFFNLQTFFLFTAPILFSDDDILMQKPFLGNNFRCVILSLRIFQASDYYFLTDPDEFATFCSPDDFNWQLLDRPMSKKEFLHLPYFQPRFYLMNASVLAPKSGTARAANGKLDVEIKFPKKQMDYIQVNSVVCQVDEANENEKGNNASRNLDKYVFVNRKASRFIFEAIFPRPGKYLFDIFGVNEQGKKERDKDTQKKASNGLERLCQFRIISDKDFEDGEVDPLPDNPKNGWGPGPHCRNLGLVPLSHFEGCIFMKPGEVRDITFRMERDLDVTCQLVHNFLPVYELVEQVRP